MKWKKENNKDKFPGQRGEAEVEAEAEEECNEDGEKEEGDTKEVEDKDETKEWFCCLVFLWLYFLKGREKGEGERAEWENNFMVTVFSQVKQIL